MSTEKKIPEISLKVKVDKAKPSEMIKITSSKTASDTFRKVMNKDTFDWTEELILLCLNRANKVVGFYKVSSGGTAGTLVDPKVVFTIALKMNAHAIILGHNHPSGTLKPSQSDLEITNRLFECGKILEIKLLDHIIMTSEGHYSLLENGHI